MTIKLSEADHRDMDVLLDTILDWVKNGDVTVQEARGAIAHFLTAAAIQNESELRSWLKPPTLAQWKQMTDSHRL